MKKIVLTGGGTAGHVTPNLALLPYLSEKGYQDIAYIGSTDGIEKAIIEKTNLPYYGISAGKFRRYLSFKNLTDPFRIIKGYFEAKKLLKYLRPSLVFSKGGYVSVPVVFAAHKLKIPVVLHESDYTPGLANRLAMPKANTICVSFGATKEKLPTSIPSVLTGMPVRQELRAGDKAAALSFLGFSGEKPLLLIIGGSLGALAINLQVDESIEELLQVFDIVHIRGKDKENPDLEGISGYRQFSYLSEELADIYAATDFAISRAGANVIFELLALQIPSLLIPLPLSASRGDQILNANYFADAGFAHVLMQEEMNDTSFLAALQKLVASKEVLQKNMRESNMQNGAENVSNVLIHLLEETS
ncbi:MAG: undecaprenyldiphospho-muramoylpentapeptide beta-N-acetylglucosaminyltransferase [Christensenellaceae bacterium]|jgi:UDP-N-acetylglucosamine--N-acetylmuramyl-(pentapeptide) pyrophosphoryl-undecaprenol N-acetylglucosamine transferase